MSGPGEVHGDGHGHGPDAVQWTAEHWNERYAAQPALWSGQVNATVAAEASSLPPGRALDVGCGEGGDALWLAARGWQVTGVDVSQVALDRAAAQAERQGLGARTTWEQRDLLVWTPDPAAYDLVTLSFFHLHAADRTRVYAGLADAVAPGGTFLVVAHDFSDHEVVPRPHEPDLFFTAADLVPGLPGGADRWDVRVAGARARTQAHPESGEPVALHDAVLLAVRR